MDTKAYSYVRIAGFLLISTGCLAGSFFIARAAAQSVTELSAEAKKEIEKKEDRLDEIKAKIKAYQQIIDLKQRQGSTLQSQIESLTAQADKLELEIGENKNKISTLQSQIESLSGKIVEKEESLLSQRKLLSELMRSYYLTRAENASAVLFVTTASDMTERLRGDEWTSQVGDKVTEVLDEIERLKAGLEQEKKELGDKKAEADSVHEQLLKQNDYLESSKNSKAVLLQKTQADVKKYDSLVDKLEQEREDIKNEIESLESDKVGELNLKDMPAFKSGLLSYPAKKVSLSQGYGKTKFARTSGRYVNGYHNGLDFSMPTGTSVLAAADGKVVATGNNGRYAYGRWMAIDHGNGIVTMYGHLSSVSKGKGSSVKRGDTIAKSGNTGNSTGPHLHFTVFSAKSFEVVSSKSVKSVRDIPIGATVNPKNYLP